MKEKEALKTALQKFSKAILKPEGFHDELAPAVMGYSELLTTNFNVEEESNREHIKTAYGNAIGTFWAARCAREIFRTQRFSRGLYKAVTDLLKQHTKTVHVLYAGTGPFATLALPVMMQFSPEEVQFTLLEINPGSIEIVKQVIDTFGLQAYIKDIHQCDATLWEVTSPDIDIVISETMYTALKTEPQVAIMLNLASQLPAETIFLPEEIKVSLSRWNNKSQKPEPLAELICFDKAQMYSIINHSTDRNWVFPDQQIQLTLAENEQLYYTTDVRINEGNILTWNESSLNNPEKVKLTGKTGERNLICQYSLEDRPGFRIRDKEDNGLSAKANTDV